VLAPLLTELGTAVRHACQSTQRSSDTTQNALELLQPRWALQECRLLRSKGLLREALSALDAEVIRPTRALYAALTPPLPSSSSKAGDSGSRNRSGTRAGAGQKSPGRHQETASLLCEAYVTAGEWLGSARAASASEVSINQSINQPINQSMTQPINDPINDSIIQSIH
jgi:hypothetical protein